MDINDFRADYNEDVIGLLTELRMLPIIARDNVKYNGTAEEVAKTECEKNREEIQKKINYFKQTASTDKYEKILTNYLLNIIPSNNQNFINNLLEKLKIAANKFLDKVSIDEDTYNVLLALFSIYNINKNNFKRIRSDLNGTYNSKPDDYTLYITEFKKFLEYLDLKNGEISDKEGKMIDLIYNCTIMLIDLIPEKENIYHQQEMNNKVTNRKNVKQEQSFSSKLKISFKKIRDFLERMAPHKRKK